MKKLLKREMICPQYFHNIFTTNPKGTFGTLNEDYDRNCNFYY